MTQTYTIPLRKAYKDKPPQRRAKTAIREVKSFLSQHMHTDEDAITVSSTLNETVWADGAANPPAKLTIVAEQNAQGAHAMTEDEYVTTSSSPSDDEATKDEPDQDEETDDEDRADPDDSDSQEEDEDETEDGDES